MDNKHVFIALIFLTVSFFARAAEKDRTHTDFKTSQQLSYASSMLNTVLFDLHRLSLGDTNSKNNPYSKVLERIHGICNTQIIFYANANTNKQDNFSSLMEEIFKGFKNAAFLYHQINIEIKKNNITAEESRLYPNLKEQATTLSRQIGILFEKRIASTTPDGIPCMNKFCTDTLS